MLSNIYFQVLIPLVYLGQYPGITLFIATITLYFTIKLNSDKKKVRLWLATTYSILYGVYDIYFYIYLYSKANIRIDLMIFGPIFYFSLLFWLLEYKNIKGVHAGTSLQ